MIEYKQQRQWFFNAIKLLDRAQLQLDDGDNEAYMALHSVRRYIGEQTRQHILKGWGD